MSSTVRDVSARVAAKPNSACLTCRKKKVKCSGSQPCRYCEKRSIECTFPGNGRRKVYPVAYIQNLQDRVSRYEASDDTNALSPTIFIPGSTPQMSPTGHSSVQTSPAPPLPLPSASQRSPSVPPVAISSTTAASQARGCVTPSPSSTIQVDASLSSNHTFGTRVQDLFARNQHAEDHVSAGPTYTSGENIPLDSPRSYLGVDLPSKSEAYQYLRTVTFYVGYTQHHFNVREVSDQMYVLFENTETETRIRIPTLQFLEVVLIFSLGKLLAGVIDDADNPPGHVFFKHATKLLPNIDELRAQGALGVEVPSLIALYLQCADQKEEAHVYANTALRLAFAQGFHQPQRASLFKQSQNVHNNRLFWTVYMQERRLAAATCSPFSIEDSCIKCELPADSPGFVPAMPLRINIEVGQLIPRILNVIYGSDNHIEGSFPSSVQAILHSIHGVAQNLSSRQSLDLPGQHNDLSLRTAASLHSMLYQTAMLTTRPILLHVAKSILEDPVSAHADLAASPFERLCWTCSEAASRLLKIVLSLREKNILAIYGFSEFEAITSAASVMILSAIVESDSPNFKGRSAQGVLDALKILHYLGLKGNSIASQRHSELQRLWHHVAARFCSRSGPVPANMDPSVPPAESFPSERLQESNTTGGDTQAMREEMTDANRYELGGITASDASQQYQLPETGDAINENFNLELDQWTNDISQFWESSMGSTFDGLMTLSAEENSDYRFIFKNNDFAGSNMEGFVQLEEQLLGLAR